MRNCSGAGNGNSIWVGPFNFTTLCSPYYMTPGYYENWDAMTAGDAPGCWTKTQTGSGSYMAGTIAPNVERGGLFDASTTC